jgi:hypothetical protein
MTQPEPSQKSSRELLAIIQIINPVEKEAPQQTCSIPSLNSRGVNASDTHFKAVLPSELPAIPQPYKQGLIPLQSQLQLHCLAQDHLKRWFLLRSRLANADGKLLVITDEDLERILTVMNMSWAQSMRECYGAGLLVFHVFYNERFIPEEQCCPVDTCTMLV